MGSSASWGPRAPEQSRSASVAFVARGRMKRGRFSLVRIAFTGGGPRQVGVGSRSAEAREVPHGDTSASSRCRQVDAEEARAALKAPRERANPGAAGLGAPDRRRMASPPGRFGSGLGAALLAEQRVGAKRGWRCADPSGQRGATGSRGGVPWRPCRRGGARGGGCVPVAVSRSAAQAALDEAAAARPVEARRTELERSGCATFRRGLNGPMDGFRPRRRFQQAGARDGFPDVREERLATRGVAAKAGADAAARAG